MKNSVVFDYECQSCGEWKELWVQREDRDVERVHECGGSLKRRWRSAPAKVSEGYEMKAIAYQGEKKIGPVAGNFGRQPTKRRRRL